MECLFSQFEDFLNKYEIKDEYAEFEFLPYDLVDKDLDMDELAYEENIITFRRYLDTLVRQNARQFRTLESFMHTRTTRDTVQRVVQYTPLEDGRMLRTTTEAL